MKLISHRGNLEGPDLRYENNPVYVKDAMSARFEVEIDVRSINGNYFLGHDEPNFCVKESFLENPSLWCHAKNGEALQRMLQNQNIHCFWHQKDKYTVTSKGIVWVFPSEVLLKNSVCVLPELGYNKLIKKCHGICSDYIVNWDEN